MAALDFTGLYRFAGAQWTKDGQVLVCSLIVSNMASPPVNEIAYDFSAQSAIKWGDPAKLRDTILLHGGLSGQVISDDLIKRKEKMLLFWQIPKR